ncbi:MAG: hypothetical protein ACOYLS_02985 [Polymorphobacter sp.]
MKHEPETVIAITSARIRYLLESPHISDWLKTALRAADGHDPIKLQNEIEILRHVIRPISQTDIDVAMRPISIE